VSGDTGATSHFYFEVTDYVRPTLRRLSARVALNRSVQFRVTGAKRASSSYAHLGADLRLGAPRGDDAHAFQRFVMNAYRAGEWRTRSLGSAPLDVTYDPVFVRLGGIFRERDNRLVPVAVTRRPIVGNPIAEYALEHGATYHIQISTHLAARLPAELPGEGTAVLRLQFDPSVFRSSGPTDLRISSTYDLHYWSVVAIGSPGQRTVLRMSCDHALAVDRENFVRKELLFPELSLPIVICAGGRDQR
jgi:hypothetical protein